MHPLKKNIHRKYLRVSSVGRLPSEKAKFREMEPLTHEKVEEMKDRDV